MINSQKNKKIIFPISISFIIIISVFLFYISTIIFRTLTYYSAVNVNETPYMPVYDRHIGQPFRIDKSLGVASNPNASGVYLVPFGSNVPFQHDKNGFRVKLGVNDALKEKKRPRLLFLGDSFTYGMLVSAENTFAYLSAKKLGGTSLNAGVPSWGLAQMLLKGEMAIPRYKPDYVIVQYSPWLERRSVAMSAPGSYGFFMKPYFFDTEKGVSIHPPAFITLPDIMSRSRKYQTSIPSVPDKINTFWEVGLPFLFNYDMKHTKLRIKRFLRLVPEPSNRPEKIIKHVYATLDDIAERNGAKMVILILGSNLPMVIPRD